MDAVQSISADAHRLALLGDALRRVLIKAGMLRPDIQHVTGPELLLFADDFCRAPNTVRLWPDTRLRVEAKVMREDGRFYIPVSMSPPEPGVSPIVLRVASDAFLNEIDPLLLATEVAARWNGTE